ncbi:hypothetical protein PACILC2_00910 [Paenibacillus cisolokensis]|uniref:HTH cro/C1-type domain-containing protein n=1 Tax=Paenibacillus cisolokensis TaxID=1658519 RepID=A0ABQ4N027_9BACL|nr:helix-turn-helix transcriptional regulator [Paenibacillus cisolokensis]GIQ61523.1 hypothetical protein PACILC2_00910 [Paenibacillus cisolokensis]
MDKIIHGICPACYLTVTEEHQYVAIIGNSGTLYYHRECEPRRSKFIKKNTPRWIEEGQHCKKLREENDYTVAELAEYIGVSENKLRKFEEGKPVTHAKLLAFAIIRFSNYKN